MHMGRTWLVFSGVELLDPRPGWAVASFNPCRDGAVVWLEFDAAAGARYVLDVFVAVDGNCAFNLSGPVLFIPPPEPFKIHVSGPVGSAPGPSGGEVEYEVEEDDGHVLLDFTTLSNARHRVRISLRLEAWRFYRLELTRVRPR
jgi:hypothetical protein